MPLGQHSSLYTQNENLSPLTLINCKKIFFLWTGAYIKCKAVSLVQWICTYFWGTHYINWCSKWIRFRRHAEHSMLLLKDILSVLLSMIIILRTDIFFSARCIIFRLQEMKYLTRILTTRATVHRSFVFCVSLKLSVNYDSKRIWKLKSDLPRDVTFGNYICSLMTYFWIKFIIEGVSGSLRVLRNDNCLWHRLKKKKKWKKFPTTAKQVELETDQRKGRKWKHQINE